MPEFQSIILITDHKIDTAQCECRSHAHKALKTSEPKETRAKYEKHIYDNQSKIMQHKIQSESCELFDILAIRNAKFFLNALVW